MAVVDVRTKRFTAKKTFRGTQVIFGERKHLLEVLESIQKAKLPRERKQVEVRLLKKLISARTEELNQITPRWDANFKRAQNPKTTARELGRIAANLSPEDYLTARALTEHAAAPPEILTRMAGHKYSAVRENVAKIRESRKPGGLAVVEAFLASPGSPGRGVE